MTRTELRTEYETRTVPVTKTDYVDEVKTDFVPVER